MHDSYASVPESYSNHQSGFLVLQFIFLPILGRLFFEAVNGKLFTEWKRVIIISS